MKTTSILAATVAAFLLVSNPSFAAEPQQPQAPAQTQPPAPTQPQAKRCYRSVHKLPFLVRVRCKTPNPQMPSQPQAKGSDS
jgi:hypothetical protein